MGLLLLCCGAFAGAAAASASESEFAFLETFQVRHGLVELNGGRTGPTTHLDSFITPLSSALPPQGADPLGAEGRWVKSTREKYAEQPVDVMATTIPGFEVRAYVRACVGSWLNVDVSHVPLTSYTPIPAHHT